MEHSFPAREGKNPVMTRILYLHAETELGGAGISLLDQLQRLPEHFRPVVALPGPGSFSARLTELRIPFEYVQLNRFPFHEERYVAQARLYVAPYWCILEAKALASLLLSMWSQHRIINKLIAKVRPGLIHINSVTLLGAGILAGRKNIPVVWHVRDVLAETWLGRWAGWLIPRHADRVVAVSRAAAGRLDCSKGNVIFVYNGIDPQRFNVNASGAQVRREFNIPPGAPCIGYVGRLTQQKGLLDLLEAAPAILKAIPDTHFLIVGSFARFREGSRLRAFFDRFLRSHPEDSEEAVRMRIRQFGLESRFHLTGPRPDVPSLMAAFDVAALPSYSEGFGLTVLEAMAMGKAIVSTRVTAIPELLRHGRHGLLVEPGDRRQLADACIRLLRDPLLASRYANHAQRRARCALTVEREARCLHAVYDAVLNKKTD